LPVKELRGKEEDGGGGEEPAAVEERRLPARRRVERAGVAGRPRRWVAAGPYIIFVAQNRLIKRTKLEAFARPRRAGSRPPPSRTTTAVAVMHAKGDEDVIIGFARMAIRSIRRSGAGRRLRVKGITLERATTWSGAEARAGATLFTSRERMGSAPSRIPLTHRGGKA
jgi:hypothetical protein